ncbi:amino acid ABC transporter substrate-binding protein [Spirulina sp. CCNP1310]|uniref:amino acid ABC transporter substrate-binding protein n=1 Tax=Spirulina sp. CCNP1310 TaxID=3110249 RepID=UPI002B1FEDFA|nr:amino acid ABC transporter substrate-binding protein [Spirulina sp. CCNP1310]MEA5421517.1 amino acid ABC transporter substrate-binding protein [Spirulina sp. CCNP1310]
MTALKKFNGLGLSLLLMGSLAACATPPANDTATPGEEGAPAATSSRLDTVKERGTLVCGVDGGIPGFSFVDELGNYSGLDVDICKAVAAAVLGDADAVEYRRLDSTERFTALAGGEVDMLSRNTTWTLSRDTSVGLEFAPTTFYDGQGVMVRADSGITTLEDFAGKSICVESGTTTELNITDGMRKAGVDPEVKTFQQADPAYAAYDDELCDGFTSDKSQLLARRTTLSTPEDHIILDITLSKEPLGPTTINNDSAWFDVVKWVTYGLIEAEELGITSENVTEMLESEDPNIRRFLGVEGELGSGAGLEDDFMVKVIEAVGNYSEIYDRNLGADSEFKLERGLNALWKDGGLLYAPPFR